MRQIYSIKLLNKLKNIILFWPIHKLLQELMLNGLLQKYDWL